MLFWMAVTVDSIEVDYVVYILTRLPPNQLVYKWLVHQTRNYASGIPRAVIIQLLITLYNLFYFLFLVFNLLFYTTLIAINIKFYFIKIIYIPLLPLFINNYLYLNILYLLYNYIYIVFLNGVFSLYINKEQFTWA